MTVVKVDRVPVLNRGSGITTVPLITRDSDSTARITTGISTYPAGTGAPLHVHNCDEQVTIRGLHGEFKPRQRLVAEIVASDGGLKRVPLICRIDTLDELDYFKHGGILHYVLRQLVRA